MNLADIRTNITLMLSLTGTPEISDAEIDRAVVQAVATLSRFFPRELVYQTTYFEDITAESFTSNAAHATNTALANKPIRYASETITNSGATVTYVRDTDYEMDYINGNIRTISSGSMSLSTSHLATYKMDGTIIDLSADLTEPITIDRVDILIAEEVPSELEGWRIFGDYLEITARGLNSQRRIVDNASIRVYYTAQHVEPLASANGSYPAFLDEVVLIGTSGYALLIEMNQRLHAAVADLTSARTRLGSIAAIHTVVGTTLTDLMTTEYTALRASLASAKAEFVLANAQLDVPVAASAELEDAKTAVELGVTSIAKVSAILDIANTLADKVEALLNGATTSAESYLDIANAELLLGNVALDVMPVELSSGTRNADNYLDQGDGKIDGINTGEDVGNLFQRFAGSKTQMAQTYGQEAAARYEHGRTLISLAGGYSTAAQAMISNVNAYFKEAELRLAEANGDIAVATNNIAISNGWVAAAVGFINNGRGYLEAAANEVAEISVYVSQMRERISEMRVYNEEATAYQTSAVSERESAAAFEREAEKRIASFFSILADRQQIMTHPVASSVYQYANYDQGSIYGSSRRS